LPVAGSRTTIDARFCVVVRLLREVVNAKDRPMERALLKLLFLTRKTNTAPWSIPGEVTMDRHKDRKPVRSMREESRVKTEQASASRAGFQAMLSRALPRKWLRDYYGQ